MSVSDIIEKIRSDSATTAEEIVAEARGEAEKQLAAARERSDEAARARIGEAERDAETARVRILALARLEARDMVLASKQSAVGEVFAAVAARLEALSDDDYSGLIEKLLVESAQGPMEVIPAAADAGVIDAGLLERTSKVLGGKASLTLGSPTTDMARGFLLRTGRIVTDCSMATLVAEARERYEDEVHERLFGNGEAQQGQKKVEA